MAASAEIGLDELDIVGPQHYVDHGYPHEAWRILRNEAPIKWFSLGPRPGFWAVTKRADIVWLSKQPRRFLNAPRLAIFPESPSPEQRRAMSEAKAASND